MFSYRRNYSFPYQDWNEYPPEAIVLVYNAYGDSKIDYAKNLWWGYEIEGGQIGEGVIVRAKRLDKPITGYKPGSAGHVSTSDCVNESAKYIVIHTSHLFIIGEMK